MIKKTKRIQALKLLPLLIPFVLLFMNGVFWTVVETLGNDNYIHLFSQRWMFQHFLYSLNIAFISAALSTLLGLLLAAGINWLGTKEKTIALVYKVPLILPHIAVGYMVFILFGQTGVISAISNKLGFIDSYSDFPNLFFSGKGYGIILAYLYKETSFAVLMIYAVLSQIPKEQLQTARMLGAGRTRTIFTVILPHVSPVMQSTFLILFIYTFGAFDIPFIIGESTPTMLSVKVFQLFFKGGMQDRGFAMTILTVMLVFSIFIITAYSYISNRMQVKQRKL